MALLIVIAHLVGISQTLGDDAKKTCSMSINKKAPIFIEALGLWGSY